MALAVAGLLLMAGAAHAQVSPPPAPPPAAAQDSGRATMGSLLGTVFDSVHSRPLVNATVFVLGTTRIGLTNASGVFIVDSVPVGTHKVHVAHELLDSLGISMVTDTFPVIAGERKAVFAIVIRAVQRMAGGDVAIAHRPESVAAIVAIINA